jgi:Tol biopolymer transport system component
VLTNRWSRIGAAFVAALSIISFAAPAQAAFPGENGKIAFAGAQGIAVMNPDGTGVTAIGGGQASYPAWSADGRRIAFASSRGGDLEIHVMNADGTGDTSLTNNSVLDISPAWSPDGKKIVFHSQRDGDTELYVMNADGTDQVRLTNRPGWDAEPAWSPDGGKIAFERGPSDAGNPIELYVMNADGTGATELPTASAEPDCGDQKFDGSPNWSPDGQKLVFHHFECPGPAWSSINTINADGTGEQVVYQADSPNAVVYYPAWSPDGTKIVYDADLQYLYTINSDGTGRAQVGTGSGGDWQPLVGSPPDCSRVTATPGVLLPANGRLRLVTLSGATDPDGDQLSLVIDGVTQDEPVGRRPDAVRPATNDQILLRAKHEKKGDGRVYRISLTVSDGVDRCGGSATVEVRRHKKQPAVDSAPPSYDSFGS